MSLYQELCYATLATSNLIVGFLVPTGMNGSVYIMNCPFISSILLTFFHISHCILEVGMGVYPRGPKGEVKAVARS